MNTRLGSYFYLVTGWTVLSDRLDSIMRNFVIKKIIKVTKLFK
jgi:hypothetical protein